MSAPMPRNRAERRRAQKATTRARTAAYRGWKKLAKGVHHPADVIANGRSR